MAPCRIGALKILRRELTRISEQSNGINRSKFAEDLETLRKQFNHTIQIIPMSTEILDLCNCHSASFGLFDSDQYLSLAALHGSAVVQSKFVKCLIDVGELRRIDRRAPSQNALVIYFSSNRIVHSGRVNAMARVVSKWGTHQFLEHDVWEVPDTYGYAKALFEPPDPKRIVDILERCFS